MKLILLGMPGSGKGTVASWLEKKYHYKQISTGDILREERKAGSELGKQVEEVMNQGKLVSDELIISLVKKHVELNLKNFSGVIFDGFPRTLEQAKALQVITTIDQVIYLKVAESVVIQRLLNRVDESGQVREDDKDEEVIKKRIEVYFNSTNPLIDYYQEKGLLTTLDGGVSIEEVRKKIDEVIASK